MLSVLFSAFVNRPSVNYLITSGFELANHFCLLFSMFVNQRIISSNLFFFVFIKTVDLSVNMNLCRNTNRLPMVSFTCVRNQPKDLCLFSLWLNGKSFSLYLEVPCLKQIIKHHGFILTICNL